MNVEARSQTIENILKKGQYIIPEYQREYDWTEENLDEFVKDINENNEENYFIGHMVCEGKFTADKFKIIDGQQRITTITIILSAIRDIFYERDFIKLASGLHENYIFAKNKDYNEYVILENKMPYPILQAYVQSKPPEKNKDIIPTKMGEKKIVKAYDKFFKEWKNFTEEQLKNLRDKILNLEIIFVAVDDEVDAFTIFETLNAKGKDLTPLDLIKNQVFKNYTKQPHINEPNDSWAKIIKNSESNTLKFLNNFWSSRYKKVSDKKIYKEFMSESKRDFNYNNFVNDLYMDSIIINKIITPKKEHWMGAGEYKIYISLNAINIFSVQVANAMLLSILREYEEKNISLKFCAKALNAIEKFHFINNAISSERSSGLDTMYSRLAKSLFCAQEKQDKHKVVQELCKLLIRKTPSLETFSSKIDDKLYFYKNDVKGEKNKKLVRYVLDKIEYSFHEESISLIDMSIEHIYPEEATEKDWPEIVPKEQISNIGNLTLLDTFINSKIGRKNYSLKKKMILEKSNLLATKEIFTNNEHWTKENIQKRRDFLITKLYSDIWS